MNELKIFTNEEFGKIRTVTIDGEPWFVGKDVAEALGYADPSSAVSKNVDTEDKTTLLLEQDGSNYKSRTTLISESGLYTLILGSKLESAKRFKHWVTSEVLPSIRTTGAYISNEDLLKLQLFDKDPLKVVQAHQQLTAIEVKKATAPLIAENKEMKPKAEFHDAVSIAENCINFGKFAATFQNNNHVSLGRNKLMDWCRKQKYLCSSYGLKNKPSQLMLTNGYMKYKQTINHINGKEYITYTPLLTGKGEIWLTKKLLKTISDNSVA